MTFDFSGASLKTSAIKRAVDLSVNTYCSVAKMLSPTVEITYAIILNSVTVDVSGCSNLRENDGNER